MRQPYLAICDKEADYAKQIMDYITRKQNISFRVGLFTTKEAYEEFRKSFMVDVLLLAENFVEEIKPTTEKTLLLFDEGGGEKYPHMKKIYKYQSASKILKEINLCLSETDLSLAGTNINRQTKIITFYSPINRCLQTSTAMRLANILGQNQKVLFINLEAYSTIECLLERRLSDNLSDLIYYTQRDINKFIYRMSAMIVRDQNIDVLPPIQNPQDLIGIEKQSWIQFINRIKESHLYDVVVIDLGESVQGFLEICENSDQILQIVRDDKSSQAVLQKYHQLLELTGKLYLQDITQKIKIPRIPQMEESVELKGVNSLEDFVERGLKVG